MFSPTQVSLRPAMAILKHGSSRPSSSPFATNPPPTSTSSSSTSSSLPANHVTGSGRGKAGDRQSPLLRTRDDSSDEEGPPNRRGGGAQMPHPQGMGPPLTNYPHLPPGTYPGPPPHMIHLGRPGVPPYFPHRPLLMHPPPHNMPMQHHRPMVRDKSSPRYCILFEPPPSPSSLPPSFPRLPFIPPFPPPSLLSSLSLPFLPPSLPQMHGPPPLGHVMPPGGPRGLFPHHPPPPGQYFGPPFHRGGPMPPPHLMYGSPRYICTPEAHKHREAVLHVSQVDQLISKYGEYARHYAQHYVIVCLSLNLADMMFDRRMRRSRSFALRPLMRS